MAYKTFDNMKIQLLFIKFDKSNINVVGLFGLL